MEHSASTFVQYPHPVMTQSFFGTALVRAMLTIRAFAADHLMWLTSSPQPKQEQQLTHTLTEVDIIVLSGQIYDVLDRELLYLDPELTPESLAAQAHVPQNQLMEVLRRGMQKSFDTLMNEYRVEAIKVLLNNPKMAELNIFLLASECGFASKKAFKKAFIDCTGQTPSAYKTGLAETDKALMV